jgi:hypothetical protein
LNQKSVRLFSFLTFACLVGIYLKVSSWFIFDWLLINISSPLNLHFQEKGSHFFQFYLFMTKTACFYVAFHSASFLINVTDCDRFFFFFYVHIIFCVQLEFLYCTLPLLLHHLNSCEVGLPMNSFILYGVDFLFRLDIGVGTSLEPTVKNKVIKKNLVYFELKKNKSKKKKMFRR